MPTINLLPWREALRQKRKQEFIAMILGAVLMGGALTIGAKLVYKGKISYQQERNSILRAEIAELDKQIEEINRLDAQKARMLDRKDIIEQLERTTPEAVMLVDAIVDTLPGGTHLTKVTQQGTNIQISGLAQSNARISDLLRNIDRSEWLKNPWLDDVTNDGSGPVNDGRFNMNMSQVRISDNQEAAK